MTAAAVITRTVPADLRPLGPGINVVLVRRLRDGRCAFDECGGTLGADCDGWRTCGECGTQWTTSVIGGREYAGFARTRA